MFTLKLYRRAPHRLEVSTEWRPWGGGQLSTKVVAVDHVVTHHIGEKGQALEIWAFAPNGSYETYFVGLPEEHMDAYGREDLHLASSSPEWWQWGLLENGEGRTSEHYRPTSYGPA